MIKKEEESNKSIDKENYYTIVITFETLELNDNEKNIDDIINFILNDESKPLLCYYYRNTNSETYELIILYSSISEINNHHLNGSYCLICSYFACILSKNFNISSNVKIVEFNTKIEIITYFIYKVTENFNSFISFHLSKLYENSAKDKKSKIDIDNDQTFEEKIQIIKKINENEWNAIKEEFKYGIFIKLLLNANIEQSPRVKKVNSPAIKSSTLKSSKDSIRNRKIKSDSDIVLNHVSNKETLSEFLSFSCLNKYKKFFFNSTL
jgi:hypothetical protein